MPEPSTSGDSRAGAGDLLRQFRRSRGMTQEELAELTGVSLRGLRDLERGKVARPRRATIDALARGLRLTPAAHAELLGAARPLAPDMVAPPLSEHDDEAGKPADARGPRGLPPGIAGFVGRLRELHQLDQVLAHDGQHAVKVITIVGTAGVGKTALAVHWAHQVAGHFPDGQLCINLRGYSPTGHAMGPAEALNILLEALGVPAQRIPVTAEARATMYRSLLADRRMLIVLDNAYKAEQVSPLIPACPASLVLVTSRNELTALTAAAGAHLVRLHLVSTAEARRVLRHRLGPGRVDAEPQAADEIIRSCAWLPLALAVAAARAAARPHITLTQFAGELRSTADALDVLTGDDPSTDVRTVFSCSYHALSPAAARLFQLSGLHLGTGLSAAAAASLSGVARRHIGPALAELVHAQLFSEDQLGWFTTHDLLRAYAAELATGLPEDGRREAAVRLLDHYLHTAYAADRLLDPYRDPIGLPPASPGTALEQLAGREPALAWLNAELPALITAVHWAGQHGFDTHSWQLAWALTTFLDYQGDLQSWAEVLRAALAAGERLGDQRAQAYAHRILGAVCTRLHRPVDGEEHFRLALALYRDLGDPVGEAHAYVGLCSVLDHQEQYEQALAEAQQAIPLYQAADHQAGLANALAVTGWLHTQLGAHYHAIRYCLQALGLLEQLGDLGGQAGAWDSLGDAHCRLRQHEQGIACYRRGIELCRQAGDRHLQAETLLHLSVGCHAAGRHDEERSARLEAQEILDSLQESPAGAMTACTANDERAAPSRE